MADDKVRLPSSSFEQVKKIIRGYAYAPKEATLSDVAKSAAINRTEISGNNGFLAMLGIISGANKKTLTEQGRELANALEHEAAMPEEVRERWREIIEDDPFIHKIVSAVRIRNGMDASSLQSHVAYSAGQPKRSTVMTGARTVIDVLVAAGLLKELEEDKYVAISRSRSDVSNRQSATAESELNIAQKVEHAVAKARPTSGKAVSINVNFDIQVQCDQDNIGSIGEKLKILVDTLTRDADESQDRK